MLFGSIWLANSATGYSISQAALFDGAGDNLSRTPSGAATSARIFTMSVWLKRAEITDTTYDGYLYCASPDEDGIALTQDDDKLAFRIEGSTYVMTAANQFRDPSAFFHLLLRIDSTQSSASNRIRIYINGSALTLTGTPPAQNYDYTRWLVASKIQRIGWNGNTEKYFSGYMAEFAMYDGTSLGPDSFGETNEDSGIWVPIKIPTSGFGNNGFYLTFSDSSALGADTSGNSNNFTVNNLVAANQVEDSPTNDANNNIGNYSTINTVVSGTGTVSNGNLSGATTSGAGVVVSFVATQAISSGKFYWELTLTSGSSVSSRIGIATTDSVSGTAPTSSIYIGQETTDDKAWAFNAWAANSHDGKIEFGNGSAQRASYAEGVGGFAAGDIVGVALDMDNGALWFSKNGTWMGANLSAGNAATIGEIAAGTVTNAAVGPNANCADNINLSSLIVVPVFTVDGVTATTTINFGQNPFTYTVPTGFKRLMTANLPAPTVTKPTDFFGAIIYEGTGAELETGDTGVATLSFKPDWVWIKNRDATDSHMIFDSVRLATNRLHSDTDDQQDAVAESLKSFDADGFTLGTDVQVNTSGESYVAWCWRAGGAPSADNSGGRTPTDNSVMKGGVAQTGTNFLAASDISPTRMSIASHGGFSIVKYTSTGATPNTLPHGLDAAPCVMLVKQLTGRTNNWLMYHDSAIPSGTARAPETGYLFLNESDGYQDGDAVWTDTAPSSTLVTLGDSSFVNQGSGSTYIAYFFSRIEGMQAFGGYVGNNSNNGPFVFTGFKPAVVIIKETDASDKWRIYDNKRDGTGGNPVDKHLFPNTNETDNTSGNIDFLSNGFKLRNTSTEVNGANDNYVYLAFAETPFASNNRAR